MIGHPKCSHSRTLVLNRYLDEQGRLVTKRLHVIYQRIPYYIQLVSGKVVTYGGEESIIDPLKKEVQVVTKNLSFTNQASVVDVSSYRENTENPNETDYSKTTTTSGKISAINNQIERWYLKNEKKHFLNGINVMNDIILGKVKIDFGLKPN